MIRPRLIGPRPRPTIAVGILAALVALGGCAGQEQAAAPTSAADTAAACPISATDTWVKAADAGMTATFGTLTNTGSTEVVLTGAASPAAGRMEIHEMADVDGQMVMRPKQGGLVLAAGASATLAPGGDHLMMIDLPAPIAAGDQVEVTLTCGSGATTSFMAVAKPFTGADEKYQPGMGASASPSAG